MAVVDLNKDGVPDFIFNNEGQESSCLIGNPNRLQIGAGATGNSTRSNDSANADDSRRNDESSSKTQVASMGYFNLRSLGVLGLVVAGLFVIRRRRLAHQSW